MFEGDKMCHEILLLWFVNLLVCVEVIFIMKERNCLVNRTDYHFIIKIMYLQFDYMRIFFIFLDQLSFYDREKSAKIIEI